MILVLKKSNLKKILFLFLLSWAAVSFFSQAPAKFFGNYPAYVSLGVHLKLMYATLPLVPQDLPFLFAFLSLLILLALALDGSKDGFFFRHKKYLMPLFFLIPFLLYLSQWGSPLAGDEKYYYVPWSRMYFSLNPANNTAADGPATIETYAIRPFAYLLYIGLFQWLFSPSLGIVKAAHLATSLFALAGLVSIFLLARKLFDLKTALASVTLISLLPKFYFDSFHAYIDSPAVIVTAVYLYFTYAYFTERSKPSLYAALFFGLLVPWVKDYNGIISFAVLLFLFLCRKEQKWGRADYLIAILPLISLGGWLFLKNSIFPGGDSARELAQITAIDPADSLDRLLLVSESLIVQSSFLMPALIFGAYLYLYGRREFPLFSGKGFVLVFLWMLSAVAFMIQFHLVLPHQGQMVSIVEPRHLVTITTPFLILLSSLFVGAYDIAREKGTVYKFALLLLFALLLYQYLSIDYFYTSELNKPDTWVPQFLNMA